MSVLDARPISVLSARRGAVRHDLYRLAQKANRLDFTGRPVPAWMIAKITMYKAELSTLEAAIAAKEVSV
jgi:hypothetical protein